jgi:hypothetical protein
MRPHAPQRLSQAHTLLSDALADLTIPASLDAIAIAMTHIELAQGMEQRAAILAEYFAQNFAIKQQREEAANKGEGFTFELPPELRQKLKAGPNRPDDTRH